MVRSLILYPNDTIFELRKIWDTSLCIFRSNFKKDRDENLLPSKNL